MFARKQFCCNENRETVARSKESLVFALCSSTLRSCHALSLFTCGALSTQPQGQCVEYCSGLRCRTAQLVLICEGGRPRLRPDCKSPYISALLFAVFLLRISCILLLNQQVRRISESLFLDLQTAETPQSPNSVCCIVPSNS